MKKQIKFLPLFVKFDDLSIYFLYIYTNNTKLELLYIVMK